MKAGTLPVFIYPRGLSILSPFLPVLEVTIFIFCLSFLFCIAVESLGHVQLFETPWTAAHQAPLSMGFSQQEYWSGLPFLSPKNTGVGCYALFQGIFPTQGSFKIAFMSTYQKFTINSHYFLFPYRALIASVKATSTPGLIPTPKFHKDL